MTILSDKEVGLQWQWWSMAKDDIIKVNTLALIRTLVAERGIQYGYVRGEMPWKALRDYDIDPATFFPKE
jgi:hypothetical protein